VCVVDSLSTATAPAPFARRLMCRTFGARAEAGYGIISGHEQWEAKDADQHHLSASERTVQDGNRV